MQRAERGAPLQPPLPPCRQNYRRPSMLNRIEFVINEAFTGLSRNRLMSFAAVTTVAVALFIFGGLGYAYFRLNSYASTFPGKFRMLVYLKDDASLSDVSKVAAELRAIPGVESAVHIPKDKAWARWKEEHPSALTQGVENPLPEGFRVILKDLSQSDQVVGAIQANPMVATENGVRYLKDEQNFVEGLLAAIRLLGAVVGGILLLISGVLIYNDTRLTVLSRRLEIRIMQLVGASRPTVYVPFLIEGIVQGVAGGLIATALVYGGYVAFTRVVGPYLPGIPGGVSTVNFAYVPVLGILVAGGACYGLFSLAFAIRAPLKYR